jgi:hypothetical protein
VRIDVLDVYQVLVARVGITINAGFAGFPFAVPITTIFNCQYISWSVA